MKIGRNDSCPCGSGLKYKKCCINDSKHEDFISPLPSIYQLIILKFLSEGNFNLTTESRYFKDLIFDSISANQVSINQILHDYIETCEKKIEEIATKYSVYELIFWSRRFGPKNIFNVDENSIRLYREIQTLAIYKYGKREENLLVDDKPSVLPKSIEDYNNLEYIKAVEKIKHENLPDTLNDILSDIVRIEILSFLYLFGTQTYRIANKGGKVVFDTKNKNILTDVDSDIAYLIDNYDENLKNVNLMSRTGTFINTDKNIQDHHFCPFFQINVNHKIKHLVINFKNQAYNEIFPKGDEKLEITPNYLFGSLNPKEIYSFLILFEDEFYTKYGFTVEDFIVFLCYLGYKVIADISKDYHSQFQILNRAYLIANYDLSTFGNDLKSLYPNLKKELFNQELDDCQIEIILDYFCLKSNDKSDINLWTRGPKRLIYQLSPNFMLLDYTGLTDIISYIVKDITSVDGNVGNRRATHFESSLINEISNCFGLENIWITQGEIISKNGRKEIDASFIINNILYILEAKAVNVSFGYDKGDEKAIEYRKNKMKSAIREVNQKAIFIKENVDDIMPRLPEGVKYICPLVISSNPEYIYEKSDDVFISYEPYLPRIMTIKEINKLSSVKIEDLKGRSWFISI